MIPQCHTPAKLRERLGSFLDAGSSVDLAEHHIGFEHVAEAFRWVGGLECQGLGNGQPLRGVIWPFRFERPKKSKRGCRASRLSGVIRTNRRFE